MVTGLEGPGFPGDDSSGLGPIKPSLTHKFGNLCKKVGNGVLHVALVSVTIPVRVVWTGYALIHSLVKSAPFQQTFENDMSAMKTRLDRPFKSLKNGSGQGQAKVVNDLAQRSISSLQATSSSISNEEGSSATSEGVSSTALISTSLVNGAVESAPLFSSNEEIEGMSFEKIQQLKEEKRLAKMQLRSAPNLTPERRSELEAIINRYDTIVEANEVLRDLRDLSRALRRQKATDEDFDLLKEFRLLMGIDTNKGFDEIKEIMRDKNRWNQVRGEIWSAGSQVSRLSPDQRKITWVTGSRSAAIPIIMRIPKPISDRPALAPTGQLLKHRIVPLTGELGAGIMGNGVNRVALSGVGLSQIHTAIGYATQPAFIYDAKKEIEQFKGFLMTPGQPQLMNMQIPRLHVAALRLKLMSASNEDVEAIKSYIKNDILGKLPDDKDPLKHDWQIQAQLIDTEVPDDMRLTNLDSSKLQRGQLVGGPIVNGKRIFGMVASIEGDKCQVILSKDGITNTIPIKNLSGLDESQISVKAEGLARLTPDELNVLQMEMSTLRERFEEIIHLLDTVQPLHLEDEELLLINDSFPIVWASCTASPKHINTAVRGEQIVREKLDLGTDVHVAFTNQENVDRLKKAVSGHGVQVLSFEAAHYLKAKASLSRARDKSQEK